LPGGAGGGKASRETVGRAACWRGERGGEGRSSSKRRRSRSGADMAMEALELRGRNPNFEQRNTVSVCRGRMEIIII
jgi:hypothetical protein